MRRRAARAGRSAARGLALRRRRGAFDCASRAPGGRWSSGVARIRRDEVGWWPVTALSPRPRWTWRRCEVQVVSVRTAGPADAVGRPGEALSEGAVLAQCSHDGERFELAMSPDAYTGFASWLESGPPRDTGEVS